MKIMSCRIEMLKSLIEAQSRISIPFIGFDGLNFTNGISDDLGMYLIVPKLVTWLGITLEQGINLFLCGILGISFFIGFLSFMSFYTSYSQRIIALAGLIGIVRLSFYMSDIYVAYAASVLAGVPFILYASKVKPRAILMSEVFLLGLFLGLLNEIRGLASLPVIVFIIIVTFGYISWSIKNKILMLTLLCIGILLPRIYFAHVLQSSEKYAEQQSQSFCQKIANKHLFWHQIYLGFGFLTNDCGIRYDDLNGKEKALSIDPDALFLSDRYEQVIKGEVYNLIQNQNEFVIHTLCAKAGIVLFYLIKYANVGLLAAIYYPKPWILDIAFFIGLGLSSAFGILTIPSVQYLEGFIAFAALFGVMSINYALDQGILLAIKYKLLKLWRAIAQWFKKFF